MMKSKVCTMANALVKKGYTKSAAFTKAWAIYNTIIDIIPSPTGQKKAYVYERDLGATTAISYHLSILLDSEKYAALRSLQISGRIRFFLTRSNYSS